MLEYALILILYNSGYTQFKNYDLNIVYNVMCKYLTRLNSTSSDLVDALFELDDDYLVFDDNDRVKLEENAMVKAIRHNTVDTVLIHEIVEDLKK